MREFNYRRTHIGLVQLSGGFPVDIESKRSQAVCTEYSQKYGRIYEKSGSYKEKACV